MSKTFCRSCETTLEGLYLVCPKCELFTSGEDTPIPKKYMSGDL